MATSISTSVLVSPQDVFTTSSTANTIVGARATTGDGRMFRYAQAGAVTLVPGTLQQATAQDTSNYQNLAVAAAAIGATQLTVSTSTTATANILAGGYVLVTFTPGQGYMYQIGGNTATSGATGLVITLNDPLLVALTTASRIDLIPNPFMAVVINPSTATSAPVGAAVYPVTNAQYGWVQTQGACNLLADGTVTVGTTLVASNATAGAVEAFTGVQAFVGIAITGIATTEYGAVNLNLS
jgi:GTP:adenosylcobinamide-phosphate guanylyltransferase